jgi:hypothetical protein
MTGIIKLTLLTAVVVAVIISGFIYFSGSNFYKDPSLRGTFVFENIEEENQWMFI